MAQAQQWHVEVSKAFHSLQMNTPKHFNENENDIVLKRNMLPDPIYNLKSSGHFETKNWTGYVILFQPPANLQTVTNEVESREYVVQFEGENGVKKFAKIMLENMREETFLGAPLMTAGAIEFYELTKILKSDLHFMFIGPTGKNTSLVLL